MELNPIGMAVPVFFLLMAVEWLVADPMSFLKRSPALLKTKASATKWILAGVANIMDVES